jgi:hypothetical protein
MAAHNRAISAQQQFESKRIAIPVSKKKKSLKYVFTGHIGRSIKLFSAVLRV